MNDFPGSPEDQDLRRLLNDAVSDVEPDQTFDEIRSRTTASGSSRRPWIWGVGAAVVATAATITAVAMMGGSPGTTGAQDPGFANESPTAGAKDGTDEPSDGPSSPQANPVTVPVYYVGDTGRGPRLFREFHTLPGSGHVPMTLALNEAVAGTSDDGDYRTDWPASTTVDPRVRAFDGGAITVHLRNSEMDLRERPDNMSPDVASMAVEQLIYTAQAGTRTRAPVQFTLNGEPTEAVLGVPAAEPLSEGDPTEVLAQVWIIEPAEGAKVESGFEVTGLANAFEANVQWELMQGEEVVESGFTTAEECCTMAPYSFTVKAPPGDYTLVVHDSDPSGGEGFPPWEDTKNITITE
jgi:hypothetical protein